MTVTKQELFQLLTLVNYEYTSKNALRRVARGLIQEILVDRFAEEMKAAPLEEAEPDTIDFTPPEPVYALTDGTPVDPEEFAKLEGA